MWRMWFGERSRNLATLCSRASGNHHDDNVPIWSEHDGRDQNSGGGVGRNEAGVGKGKHHAISAIASSGDVHHKFITQHSSFVIAGRSIGGGRVVFVPRPFSHGVHFSHGDSAVAADGDHFAG